jgi:GNAT superfamily N-acetyltransferase
VSAVFEIRIATKAEFSVALEWAKAEGWNPGLDDLDVLFAADPKGFLMGFLGETPVASISVVKYSAAYGFLGLYIVPPQHRGKGYGIAIWNAGLAYLAGCTIGLDGVVARQDDYIKSGFHRTGRNIRFQGILAKQDFQHEYRAATFKPVRFTAGDFAAVSKLDTECFGTPRAEFLQAWLFPPAGHQRQSFVVKTGAQVVGFATVRKCHEGAKIGPLFAQSPSAAKALFYACCQSAALVEPIIIDVPEANAAAVNIAREAGLFPVFETARMVCGQGFALPLTKIFGITTLELG